MFSYPENENIVLKTRIRFVKIFIQLVNINQFRKYGVFSC